MTQTATRAFQLIDFWRVGLGRVNGQRARRAYTDARSAAGAYTMYLNSRYDIQPVLFPSLIHLRHAHSPFAMRLTMNLNLPFSSGTLSTIL